ncbi:hypothetical protein BX600DRAFT_515242 [Xylariales sp. PMI_506]|nr:hypothetical protein BX600DRAFT_515242 [Xylariales sp. PMI_506]
MPVTGVEEKQYGRRLLPIVVEEAAAERPDRVAYSFPITDNPAEGFHDITNRRYANGVNRTAWWIEESFGKPEPRSFPSIGYIGPNDLRYAMLTIAAVKMLFLSPRNSVDGHLAVIDRCGCDLWVLPAQRLGHVDEVLEKRPMNTVPLPEQLDLLREDAVPKYPYHKTFADARQDPFVVLHTSGSTGLPKPIIVPNGSLATPDAHHLLPPVEGRLTQAQFFVQPHRAYSTFPNFHSAGMVWCCAFPFFYELSIVLGPPLVPVNLDLVNAMLDYGHVDGSFLAPSTIEDISKNPSSLARLVKTEFTAFGGGPLSQECGDQVNTVTRVFNFVGVTEGSLFPIVQAEREDWNYIHFHPAGGYTFQDRGEGLFEQFQTRDPKLDLFQAFFQTFPDLDEIAIKDLYSKHPTKPGRWLYRGRIDDVIVLSNGEKVNPLDMEACINTHPDVKATLVVGQGKFQTAALVQLHEALPTSKEGVKELKETLWERMMVANHEAPAHGQLHKDYIIFASADKPFLLAGKETVLRAMTVKLYETEINEFYAAQESQLSNAASIDTTDYESISKGVHKLLTDTLPGAQLAENDDFFIIGLDSLSVFKVLASVRATLKTAIGMDETAVTASIVYANPTIKKLSKAVDILIRPMSASQATPTVVDEMQELLKRYTRGLPDRDSLATNITVSTGFSSVILTGSTGSLGSYLLDTLLANSTIQRVFCLNRSADARERQLRANSSRGLNQELSSERVKFIQADLSKANFGLDTNTYDELLRETTYIIHNQWQVDFNLSLSSFEPHIQGVRRLVDFSLQSSLRPAIFFVSSIGVVMKQQTNEPVPETLITDFAVAEGGYGCSKLIAELIFGSASQTSGIKCSICRLGQVAGPVDIESELGMWNKQEWLPSIVISSKYLGMVPSTLTSLERVDWLPVNHAAKIIAELAGLDNDGEKTAMDASSLRIFHGVNPNSTSWSSLVETVTSFLGPEVSVVPWTTWLSALEASAKDGNLDRNPGIKLLEFYKDADRTSASGLELPVLQSQETQESSETLRTVGPVKKEWMSQWMKQWGF